MTTLIWITIAISNVMAAYSLWRFVNHAIPELRAIRRATDVVKYHILREVHDKRKAEIEASKVARS